MASNPQPASDPEQAKREAKREYASQYRAKQRELKRITPEELPLFQADPLREEKLSLKERDWEKVIVCRLCGFRAGRLTNHLVACHAKELLDGFHIDGLPRNELIEVVTDRYRKRFGYNKGTPLSCSDFRDKNSERFRIRNSRRRHQARPAVGKGARFKKKRYAVRGTVHPGVEARREWGTSEQARQRMSAASKGKPRSSTRMKRLQTGEKVPTAPDWQLARLRLDGKEMQWIAGKVGLDDESVRARLRRIGFPPGRPCRFFRGQPIGQKHLLAHFEDLTYIRNLRPVEFRADGSDKELSVSGAAKLLGVPESWVYAHTRQSSKDTIPHSRTERGTLSFLKDALTAYAKARRHGVSTFLSTVEVEKELADLLGISPRQAYGRVAQSENYKNPLLVRIADKLLTSIHGLRSEFRQLGSTAKGGRPKALLPSEERELPGKYQALKSDLQLMLTWAERESEKTTLERLGEWMCAQSRKGKLQVLLFWPSVHEQLPAMCERVRNRVHGGSLGSAERAKELICHEYGISRPQLVKAINEARSQQLAA